MVDSGNLAGHLLVHRQGLLELADTSILPLRTFEGLRDTARVLLDAARAPQEVDGTKCAPPVSGELVRKVEAFERASSRSGHRTAGIARPLAGASLHSRGDIVFFCRRGCRAHWWAAALERACNEHLMIFFYWHHGLALSAIAVKPGWQPISNLMARPRRQSQRSIRLLPCRVKRCHDRHGFCRFAQRSTRRRLAEPPSPRIGRGFRHAAGGSI